jgi:hypothetical protein
MTKTSDIRDSIQSFVPESSLNYVENLIFLHPCHLNITQHRKTKNGDFKVDLRTEKVKISVNGTLNPYAFVITLLHEFAHFITWKDQKKGIKPHGPEWKRNFREMMIPLFEARVFPEDLERVLAQHLRNPKASSSGDTSLMKCLRQYDETPGGLLIEDLPDGEFFFFREKKYLRLSKIRKRIKCEETASGKVYIFSPIATICTLDNMSD